MTGPDRAFLEVENSISGLRWVDRLDRVAAGQAERMTTDYRIDDLVARIMAARQVQADDAAAFLNPTLRELLPDPSILTSMDDAVACLAGAIERGERVAIFGDYDVDGATSAALLSRYLAHCHVPSEIYIPDRIFEGYGPNPAAIRGLIENGAKLIVTVDCGSTSHEALEEARVQGVPVVVLDHHQLGEHLPAAAAVVNPNRQDDLSGLGHLCAAGVVFMALVALNRELRARGRFADNDQAPDLMTWLDLVALGTVCDVVPLVGINRAFVRRGLQVMQQQGNPGLAALAAAARQDGPAAPWHLGFLLGPRINAGGRIGDAALGARLLTTNDPAEAEAIAQQLDTLNSERQSMEAAMVREAGDQAEAEFARGDGPSVIVTQSETWHAGVVGLIASRLKERFSRPAIAIAFDDQGIGSGSGRSISGVDLGTAIRTAVDEGILRKGGGHVMAAGLTVERSKLADLRAFLETQLDSSVRKTRDRALLKIDGALSARAATSHLFDEIQRVGPFGAGNPQPVFAFPGHSVKYADVVGVNHVRFALASADGAQVQGIAFRQADTALGEALLASRGKTLHFAGTLNADFFRGTRRIQLSLRDAAFLPDRI